jgi:hypothetical protein
MIGRFSLQTRTEKVHCAIMRLRHQQQRHNARRDSTEFLAEATWICLRISDAEEKVRPEVHGCPNSKSWPKQAHLLRLREEAQSLRPLA